MLECNFLELSIECCLLANARKRSTRKSVLDASLLTSSKPIGYPSSATIVGVCGLE